MKVWFGVLSIAAALVLSGCSTKNGAVETEKEVALSEVPEAVLTAAKGAVEGFVPIEAEIEEEDGKMWYELEGTADGKTYEIEVTKEGKVLEVEQEDV